MFPLFRSKMVCYLPCHQARNNKIIVRSNGNLFGLTYITITYNSNISSDISGCLATHILSNIQIVHIQNSGYIVNVTISYGLKKWYFECKPRYVSCVFIKDFISDSVKLFLLTFALHYVWIRAHHAAKFTKRTGERNGLWVEH